MWHEPKDGDGGHAECVRVVVGGGAPISLNEGGDKHGEDREDDAGANTVEEGDGRVPAREGAKCGDEEAIIEWDPKSDGDKGEDLDRARWNLEMGPEVAVHF